MSCELTKTLQKSAIKTPHLLDSDEWKTHIEQCIPCYNEASNLDKSLELYLHLEKSNFTQLPEIQVWPQIQQRTQKVGTSSKKWVWTIGAAAAAVVLLLGISMWTEQLNPPSHEVPIASNSIPSEFKVIDIQVGEPFGPPSAHTQFVWTSDHFGISIKNQIEGNYSSISIGAGLSKEFAQIPLADDKRSQELAYFSPEHFNKISLSW